MIMNPKDRYSLKEVPIVKLGQIIDTMCLESVIHQMPALNIYK